MTDGSATRRTEIAGETGARGVGHIRVLVTVLGLWRSRSDSGNKRGKRIVTDVTPSRRSYIDTFGREVYYGSSYIEDTAFGRR